MVNNYSIKSSCYSLYTLVISPRYKNLISLIIDAASAAIVSILALYLRLGDTLWGYSYDFLTTQAVIFTLCVVAVNYIFKVHKGIWRYFNLSYFYKISKSSALAVLCFVGILFVDSRLDDFPRSVAFINYILLVLFLCLPRILYTLWFNKSLTGFSRYKDVQPTPILIIGLGNSSEIFISEVARSRLANYKIVGVIDSKSNVGRTIYDIPVIGTLDNIEHAIKILDKKRKRPARMLISHEMYIGGKLKKIISLSDRLSIPIAKLPKLTELQHNLNSSPIQSIPVEDLLRRHQRVINKQAVASFVKGQSVLITGAGGSIGSEIVRQVAECNPAEIYLLDHSEFLLYEIQQETKAKFPNIKSTAKLIDIRDEKAVYEFFHHAKPSVVFHSAALKHVPLLEDHKTEAVQTNIFGTKNIVDACTEHEVKNFIMISTDKAVNPSSFMGSTKRFAEMYCQSLPKSQTNITIVRFGNVLGSNGSVVPIFEKQIAAGGPVTVTDSSATRYFMTIREAVGLVLQATVLNENEKKSNVYVLDMGEPIKIIDLAKHMITLAGLKPNVDIKISVIGLRPGEKLHEELYYSHENLSKTSNDSIFLAPPVKLSHRSIVTSLKQLVIAIKKRDNIQLSKVVKKAISTKN
jgi:O-antigen biosynthesis protein WbqV